MGSAHDGRCSSEYSFGVEHTGDETSRLLVCVFLIILGEKNDWPTRTAMYGERMDRTAEDDRMTSTFSPLVCCGNHWSVKLRELIEYLPAVAMVAPLPVPPAFVYVIVELCRTESMAEFNVCLWCRLSEVDAVVNMLYLVTDQFVPRAHCMVLEASPIAITNGGGMGSNGCTHELFGVIFIPEVQFIFFFLECRFVGSFKQEECVVVDLRQDLALKLYLTIRIEQRLSFVVIKIMLYSNNKWCVHDKPPFGTRIFFKSSTMTSQNFQ